MPTQSEFNQFRRLIGDYPESTVDDFTAQSYLDDAARETSVNDPQVAPALSFDTLDPLSHVEAIYLAAINWWWDRSAKLLEKHTTTVGQASQNVGEKWDRAMRMIEQLQATLTAWRTNTDGNFVLVDDMSYFSKNTLSRIGGVREEDTDAKY